MTCPKSALALLHFILLLSPTLLLAEDKEPVPADTCVVDVTLPEGAILNVNGIEYGSKRTLTYNSLVPDTIYSATFLIRFPSGVTQEYPVVINGGQRVRLAAQDPGLEKPELVLQTGHSASITTAAFSSTGRYVLSGGADGKVLAWDANTGLQVRAFELKPFTWSAFGRAEMALEGMAGSVGETSELLPSVGCVALVEPDQRMIVGAHPPKRVLLAGLLESTSFEQIDANSGKSIGHTTCDALLNPLAISPNGQLVAVGGAPISPEDARLELAEEGIHVRPHTALLVQDTATGRVIHELGGYDCNLDAGAFSADGRFLIAGGQDVSTDGKGNALIEEQRRAAERGDRQKLEEINRRMAEESLRTPERNRGVAIVWDIAGGKEIARFTDRDEFVDVAISSRGTYVATLSATRTVHLWSVPTKAYIRRFAAAHVAFSSDESRIILADKGAIRLMDVATGNEVGRMEHRNMDITDIAMSPNGEFLLATYERTKDGPDRSSPPPPPPPPKSPSRPVQDESHRPAPAPEPPHTGIIASRTSRSSDRASSQGHPPQTNREIVLWSLPSCQVSRTFQVSADPVDAVCVAPRGQMMITGGNLWNLDTGERAASLIGPNIKRCDATFTPEGARVAITGHSMAEPFLFGSPKPRFETATLIELAKGSPGHRLGVASTVLGTAAVSVSSDGQRALTAMPDGNVWLWNAATGEKIQSINTGSSNLLATLSPDGTQAALVGTEIRTLWWDRDSGQQVVADNAAAPRRTKQMSFMLFGGGDSLHPLDHDAFNASSTDGRHVMSTSDRFGGVPVLRAAGTGQIVRRLDIDLRDGGHIERVGFDETERRVFARIAVPSLRILSVASRQIHTLAHGDFGRSKPSFSDDGHYLAVGDSEGRVSLWDVQSQRNVREYKYQSPVTSVAFGPKDKVLLAGYSDRTAIVWDRATGRRIQNLKGHDGPLTSVTLGLDGTVALTTSVEDATARMWEVATGQELAKLITVDNRQEWLVVTPEGLFDGSAGGRQKVAFRVGGGLNVVPVDRFFQDFYYPGLLAAIWRGERPLPKVRLGENLPPKVRITSPSKSGVVEKNAITVEVEVEDQGGGIEGPWIRQNGMRVVAEGETVRDGKVLRRTFRLSLIEGKNEIEVQAASGDGAWESEPARISLEYNKAPQKSDLYLVSVGIEDYPGEKLDLKYPRVDADAMANLFASRGPEFYEHVYRTDVHNAGATKSGILAAIRTVARKASPRDTLVLFLAGHGAMIDDQYYFLPGDFDAGGEKWSEAVIHQGLAATEVGQAVTAVPALRRMLVFDTGQSGIVAEEATARSPFSFRGAIERLGRAQGGFTIASCSASKNAHEVSELQHGILTYSLLAGMKAVNGGPLKEQWIQPEEEKGVVRVLEWFGFADSQVARLTEQLFGTAQPVQHSSAGVSFPVLPIPVGETPASRQPPTGMVREVRPEATPAASVGGSAAKSDFYLVAVGINQYAASELNLKYARPDAQAIADLFRQRGAAVYDDVHIVTLLDRQATKAEILAALAEIAEKAGPEDALMLYLSGHGKMVGQRYYLITHEFKPGDASLDDAVRAQCLAADEIGDGLAKIRAERRLLVFDTCASGGALGLKQGAVDPFAFRGAIDRLGAKQGTFAIAASASSGEAQEDATLGHGVLTYALLAGLGAVDRGPLVDRAVRLSRPDGMVDVMQWFSFASGQGPRLMKDLFGREQFIEVSGRGISFAVLPIAATQATRVSQSDSAPPPSPPPASPATEKPQPDKPTGHREQSASAPVCGTVSEELAPEVALRILLENLSSGRLHLVWDELPTTYQEDVQRLVRTFGEKMDADVWTAGFELAKKIERVANEKKEYSIIAISRFLRGLKAEDLSRSWDPAGAICSAIIHSDISDLEKLRNPDVRGFLAGPGQEVWRNMNVLSTVVSWNMITPVRFLRNFGTSGAFAIELISLASDRATLTLAIADQEPEIIEMTRIGGKWLPAAAVHSWQEVVEVLRLAMERIPAEETTHKKPLILAKMDLIGSTLDGMLEAEDADAFCAKSSGFVLAAFSPLEQWETIGTTDLAEQLSRLRTRSYLCLHILNASDADLRQIATLRNQIYGLDLALNRGILATLFRKPKPTYSDLTPLATLTNLTILKLDDCPEVRDLSPLAGLTQLTTLRIVNGDEIRDLAPLSDLPNLRVLCLDGCDGICDLRPLAKLTKLETLDLRRCDRISKSDVEELGKELPNCKIQY